MLARPGALGDAQRRAGGRGREERAGDAGPRHGEEDRALAAAELVRTGRHVEARLVQIDAHDVVHPCPVPAALVGLLTGARRHEPLDVRAIGVRRAPPIGSDRGVHQPWVDGDERLVLQVHRRRARRAERLDEHVGAARQVEQRLTTRGRRRVEGDATLAALPHHVAGTRRCRVGPLHTHDVGAVVGEQHRGHRSGDAVGDVDHPDAVEDPSHDGPPFHHDQFALLYREHHRGFVMGALERNVGPG